MKYEREGEKSSFYKGQWDKTRYLLQTYDKFVIYGRFALETRLNSLKTGVSDPFRRLREREFVRSPSGQS